MEICVYGASSSTIDKSYIDAGELLGAKIAKRNHIVVYGGGATEGYTRYDIKPKSIRVSGSEAVLADLTEIVLGTVNFAELRENTQMTFPINLPEGVTNLTGITEVTADISFVGLSTKEFTVEKITVVNVPVFELPKTGSGSMQLLPIVMVLAYGLSAMLVELSKRKYL